MEEEKRPGTNQNNRDETPASRSGRFQDGAYRMVFKNDRMKSDHHNRLNLRDVS